LEALSRPALVGEEMTSRSQSDVMSGGASPSPREYAQIISTVSIARHSAIARFGCIIFPGTIFVEGICFADRPPFPLPRGRQTQAQRAIIACCAFWF
jgi:hypothetical protein